MLFKLSLYQQKLGCNKFKMSAVISMVITKKINKNMQKSKWRENHKGILEKKSFKHEAVIGEMGKNNIRYRKKNKWQK